MSNMNFKGILAILLMLSIIFTSINILTAEEISIADEKFNIPDGFNEDTNRSKIVKDTTGTLNVKVYSNVYTDMIAINVLTPNDGKLLLSENEPGFVNKTIKGIHGIYNNDSNEFQYISGTKLISISAHNQSLLEQVLIEKK